MKERPTKLITMVLTGELNLFNEVFHLLENDFGMIDFLGEWHPFIHTKYYAPEMGDKLQRRVVSFKNLISPSNIFDFKARTIAIENKYRLEGKRRVNIDPGYVDHHKVVLASGKGGGHMIMQAQGVYVDLLLWYNKGWQLLPWAYPDFRDGTYFSDLTKIRNMLT